MRALMDDRERCARMGEAGKAKVVHFQAQTVIERIEHAYGQLVGSRPDGR